MLALPMVAIQAFLLDASYAGRNSAIGLVGTELSDEVVATIRLVKPSVGRPTLPSDWR